MKKNILNKIIMLLTALTLCVSAPFTAAAQAAAESSSSGGLLEWLGSLFGISFDDFLDQLPEEEEVVNYLIDFKNSHDLSSLTKEDIMGYMDQIENELQISIPYRAKNYITDYAYEITQSNPDDEQIRDAVHKLYKLAGQSEDSDSFLDMLHSWLFA